MKRFILLAMLCLLGTAFSAPKVWAEKQVTVTTFPLYLFTKSLIGPKSDLSVNLLLDPALGCPHDYSLTPANLENLSRTDILVINGLGLESFLQNALKVTRKGIPLIDASRGLPLESAPGEGEAGGHEPQAEDGLLERRGHPNAHIFASPSLAVYMVRNISQGLAAQDPEAADEYRQNGQALESSLEALRVRYRAFGERTGPVKVAASHEVFDYMIRDLGWEVAEEIEEGESGEISAARLTELLKAFKAKGVRLIMVDPTGNLKLASTLGREAALPVVVIDPVSSGPADAPPDYYQKAMEKNLEVLGQLFKQSETPK